ncbi:MAG: DUF1501 domain-containing protein, partial [Chthonomonadales bacterium]
MSEFDHRPRVEDLLLSRRELLGRIGGGMAALGLASVLGGESTANASPLTAARNLNPLAVKQPHFPVKAKRIIFLFANGGPSHVDTFDPKPMLTKYHG